MIWMILFVAFWAHGDANAVDLMNDFRQNNEDDVLKGKKDAFVVGDGSASFEQNGTLILTQEDSENSDADQQRLVQDPSDSVNISDTGYSFTFMTISKSNSINDRKFVFSKEQIGIIIGSATLTLLIIVAGGILTFWFVRKKPNRAGDIEQEPAQTTVSELVRESL
jgi:hypothetical protein